jgi:YHS domain-containing protein
MKKILSLTLVLTMAFAITAGLSAAEKAKKASAINDKCPVSGKAVDASKTSSVEVSFCCGNCQGKFDKNPTAHLGKVKALPTRNCPMSGKAVDASKTSKVSVGFCCGNCKGKFDKDPAKFLSKVKAPAKKKKG